MASETALEAGNPKPETRNPEPKPETPLGAAAEGGCFVRVFGASSACLLFGPACLVLRQRVWCLVDTLRVDLRQGSEDASPAWNAAIFLRRHGNSSHFTIPVRQVAPVSDWNFPHAFVLVMGKTTTTQKCAAIPWRARI